MKVEAVVLHQRSDSVLESAPLAIDVESILIRGTRIHPKDPQSPADTQWLDRMRTFDVSDDRSELRKGQVVAVPRIEHELPRKGCQPRRVEPKSDAEGDTIVYRAGAGNVVLASDLADHQGIEQRLSELLGSVLFCAADAPAPATGRQQRFLQAHEAQLEIDALEREAKRFPRFAGRGPRDDLVHVPARSNLKVEVELCHV